MKGNLFVALALMTGIATGFGAGYLFGDRNSAANDEPIKAIAVEAPAQKLNLAEAEKARSGRYADITSITEVLALPTDFAQTEALYALAGRADIDALKNLIRQAAGIASDIDRRAGLSILFSRFTELDADNAIDYARRLDIGGHRYQVMTGVFATLAKIDLDHAIDAANALSNRLEIQAAGEGIVYGTMDADPALRDIALARLPSEYNVGRLQARTLADRANRLPLEAADEAMAITSRMERQSALRGIADAWAKQDPVEAMQFAATITDRQSRYHFQYALVRRWAQTDGETAIEMIRSLPKDNMQRQMLYTALSEFAQVDPLRALDAATSLGAEPGMNATAMVYAAWAQNDAQSALAHAEAMTDIGRRGEVLRSIAYQYASQSPQEALAWADSLIGPERAPMMQNVLQSVASEDPNAAFDYILSMEDSTARGRALSSVIYQLAHTEPMRAAENIDLLPPGQQQQALVTIAAGLAQRDLDQALGWVNGLDSQQRKQAMNSVLGTWAMRDAGAAARYVEQLPPEDQWQAAQAMAHNYAEQNPRRAFEWILSLDGEQARQSGVSTVAGVWARKDPRAAANMMAQYADEPWAQAATQSVISSWAAQDPAAASNWLERLNDGDAKNQSASSLAMQWSQYDADAATSWARGLRGDTRDHALSSIANSQWLETDQRLRIVQSIGDDDMRLAAVANMVYRLRGTDRAAAESAIRRGNLTREQEDQLRQQLDESALHID